MTQSRKYRSFGVRRANNLSDINNPVEALNNLLNDLEGVGEETGKTFISADLDAIRGLKDTNITPESFNQLAQTTPKTTRLDAQGNVVLDDGGAPVLEAIEPLVRLEDRFKQYRLITEDPPVFASGQGPRAFFIPSSLLPTEFGKDSKIEDELESNLSNPLIRQTDDFWILGEFVINDRFQVDFPDSFGGILWEGFYLPNPIASTHTFTYVTSGLFHAEYDRFGDGNWQVLKSIYAKKREVLVESGVTESFTIELQEGETKYVSEGDFLDGDPEAVVIDISGNTIEFDKEITVTANTITLDMPLGSETTSHRYTIDEIFDRGEVPQMKLRFFWWFPVPDNPSDYTPNLKYFRKRITGRTVFDYFFLNQEPAANTPGPGSVRETLENAVTASQEVMGGSESYREFKSSSSTESLYVPKSEFSQISKGSTNISFKEGNRSATGGDFTTTELGNVILPTDVNDLGSVVPKNMKIKDLLGSNIAASSRLVNQQWPETRDSYSVSFIDHNGLVDYFVASSNSDIVTVSDTSLLRPDLICITDSTGPNDFVHITEILSETEFRTSTDLDIESEYLFVYANAGILDRSLDVFCVGVFGQVLTASASSGTNTLELVSAAGVEVGQIVQFGDSIPSNTSVTDVSGTIITLSNNIIGAINQDETIVFAPSGTSVNKEICVLPLDLSPPFIGTDTGLRTDGKNIKSSKSEFNLKVDLLEFKNTDVDDTVSAEETYDRLIQTENNGLSIIARKI